MDSNSRERMTYDVGTAAKLLGLSRNSAYLACLRGDIPCLRIGKRLIIPKIRLDEMLSGKRAPQEPTSEATK